MNTRQQALDPIIPVRMFNERMVKIADYKSISKAHLYTELPAQKITKLINSEHTTPVWCEKFNQFVYFRKN